MNPARFAAAAFLALIYLVPLGQAAWELSKGEPVQALDVVGLPSEPRLRAFEDELHDVSFLYQVATPWYQLGLYHAFGRGNERIFVGEDDWLYYADDLEFVAAGSFLDLEDDEGNTVVGGIVRFRDQLAEQGVELVMVLVPVKPESDPRFVGPPTRLYTTTENAHMRAFLEQLDEHRVELVDVAAVFETLRSESEDDREPMFMPRDTHWTPQSMQRVASVVARRVEELVGDRLERRASWSSERRMLSAQGDMPSLITVPEGVELFDDMELEVRRVLDESGDELVFDQTAEVLVLGDSFTGVFSMERLGIGTSAGFAEQIALELSCPVDSIAIPDGSSLAVRSALARRERPLEGKKVVVWEIGTRTLMGDVSRWRPVDLGGRGATDAGGAVVRARVTEASRVPDGFAYALALVVHELEVLEVESGSLPDGPLWVAFEGMVDFELGAGDRIEVGQELRLTLEPVELHHDLEATTLIDDVDSGFDIFWATDWE